MKSEWSDADANELGDRLADAGVSEDLASRVYTTRLLGRDPKLVLHGGGNTSVKSRATDVTGAEHDVLHVKGSGWDMADIEAEGLPAVKLEPLLKLRSLESLADEEMVNFERANLINSSAPTPSIETLLHAFLPHRFIDHTHSTAILSLTNQPDGDALCHEVFKDRAGIVPYIKPGFDLAQTAATVFEKAPGVEALILLKHGIFTFADSARETYEAMIEAVTLVEGRLQAGRKAVFPAATLPDKVLPAAEVAPVVRGACALLDESGFDGWRRLVLDFRTGQKILDYVNGKELGRYSQAGVATPDHTMRTKNWPVILPAPLDSQFKTGTKEAVADFISRYPAYFQRNNDRQADSKIDLDPMPRVILVPGLGLFGAGTGARDAAIAADIAESTVETVTDAESIGAFEGAGEAALFDIE